MRRNKGRRRAERRKRNKNREAKQTRGTEARFVILREGRIRVLRRGTRTRVFILIHLLAFPLSLTTQSRKLYAFSQIYFISKVERLYRQREKESERDTLDEIDTNFYRNMKT